MKWKVLLLTLLLTGCAATAGIPPQEIVTGDVGRDVITETSNHVENIYGMKPYELIMMCVLAGWAIPSPFEMTASLGKFVCSGLKGAVDIYRYARG